MTKYVIMNKATGRFYVSSSSSKVDHYDPSYAKVFPTMRSAKQAMKWFNQSLLNTNDPDPAKWTYEPWDPGIFEAQTTIVVGNQVEV